MNLGLACEVIHPGEELARTCFAALIGSIAYGGGKCEQCAQA